MELRRTANAGVLLTLDDTKILLDGVSQEVKPYLATPPAEKEKLSSNWPDVVVFTHYHEDHCDSSYANDYSKATGRPVYGTSQMTGMVCTDKTFTAGNVRLTAASTRHMATTEKLQFIAAMWRREAEAFGLWAMLRHRN